ncbi:MAG: MATE family efflux transporter [Eubacterium sp.]
MAQTQTNDLLEKESLGRLMRKYAIPCVISLLVAALYNIVDQIFIANADYLGSYGNAANTVVFPLTVVALSIAMMIGDGCCTFVSISLGAKEKENAHRGVGTSVIAVIAVGIVLMAIYLIFQEPILTAFGARVNDETFRLSKEYFFWITLGIPFYMFGQAMNPIIRSDGSPNFAMATLLTGAVLNIIFDPICIYVLKWGMMGAAVATIFGQIVSAIMSAVYLSRMKSVKMKKDSFKFRTSLLKKILPLGATSFLSQISIVLSMAAVLNMVTKYGALDPIFGQEQYAQIPTAVIGIVMKFFQIVISISVGLAAGCIPIAGYNVGAQRSDRVKRLMKLLLAAEFIVGLIASVLFLLFPHQFINIFGAKNESVYYTDFAVKTIRIFLCLLPLSCLNKGTFIFLQSLGKAKQSTALSLMREIIFGVGLPILLPIFMGLEGILLFMPIADILTAVASVIIIVHTNNTLNRMIEAPQTESRIEITAGKKPCTDYIITIGRSYGAGGRSIGKKVAEQLNIPYYDSALLEKAAQSSGLSRKFLQSIDEKPIDSSMLYRSVGFGSNAYNSIANQAQQAQREIIEKIAAEGPCVIVGRSADQVLAQTHKLFRVFISSSEDNRIKRIMERDHLSEVEAGKKLSKVDKERAAYYNQRSKTSWGNAQGYDLCIDTDWFGIDGACDIITATVSNK